MALPDRLRPRWQPAAHAVGTPAAPPPVYAAPPPEPPTFLDVLRKLWRYRLMILVITAVFAALSVVIVKQMPSYYVAESRVLVGLPPMRALNIEAIIADMSPDSDRVQNESFIIMSRDIARQTIEKLGLIENPEFNPLLREPSLPAKIVSYLNPLNYLPESWLAALQGNQQTAGEDPISPEEREMNIVIDTLLNRIEVATLGRSHVLSIQVQSQDPYLAAKVANTLADAYLARQRADKVAATEEVEQFLAERIAALRQQVEESDRAVEEYRRANGLYKGANVGVTTQQLTELNTQLILAQTAKAEADARLSEAMALSKTGLTGESVPEVLNSTTIQGLKQQEAAAAARLAELSEEFGPQHPQVIRAKAEVADVRRKIRAEINSIIGGLRHEARTTGARYEALRQNFERLQNRLGGVNEKQIRLDALEREATVNRNLLEQMLSRAKETIGQDQLAKPNAKLISSAAPPNFPAFPPKTLIVFLGVLGGALIAIIIALLRDSADMTFRRGDQIEAMTGLPVLALVPAMRGRMEPVVHVLRRPISPYTEALRKLHNHPRR
jgi:succinoglycan biosynthesis transport protein ExoP